MIRPFSRVVVVGSVLGEVVLAVPDRPVRGGEVVAESSLARVGRGAQALLAARRTGLDGGLAAHLGAGPIATAVENRLREEGVELFFDDRQGEQGLRIVTVEPDGARSGVVSPGTERPLTADDLARVSLREHELAFLSVTDLATPGVGDALARWCADGDGLGAALLVLDVGPRVADVSDDVLDAVLGRVDVVVIDDHGLEVLGGRGVSRGGDVAARAVLDVLSSRAVLLVRDGIGYRRYGDGASPHTVSDGGFAADSVAHQFFTALAAIERGEESSQWPEVFADRPRN